MFLVFKRIVLLAAVSFPVITAQTPPSELKQREALPPVAGETYQIAPNTHILLRMINTVNTKQSVVGDRLYLETAFPVTANGRVIVPEGSWVTGTVVTIKRPKRVKGRGELSVRFDSLTLPNGTTRDFRADLGAVDASEDQKLNREKGTVVGPGNKAGDVGTVVKTTTAGTIIGSGIGAAASHAGMGAGVGAGAGAAAGLLGVLLSRGPDATLTRGSTVEMVLDRPVAFTETELTGAAPPQTRSSKAQAPTPKPTTTPQIF